MAVPKIRFPGFTDAWEQRKLGDVLEITTRLNNDNEYDKQDVLSVSDEYGLINQIKFQGRSFAANDVSGYKKVQPDDIVYTRSPLALKPYGIIKKSFSEAGIISPLYIVNTVKEGNDSTFLYYNFDSPEKTNNYLKPLVRMGAKHTMNISNDEWLSGEIWITSEEEQKKIGKFFRLFDNALTLHQRKLESMKLLKKSLLQKMFPKSGETVPEVRFPGFTDAWEQRKLGDIVERITRKNTNNESDLPLTISAQYGLIDQNEFFDKRIASKDVSGYYLVKNGEFAYNKSTSNDAPWGAVKRLDRYKNGVVSTLYIVFSIRDSNTTDSDFLATYYDTDRWHSGIQAVAAEGARNHGLLNISASDFFNTTLKMPADIEEQRKIGAFFKEIDNTITLHQRELICRN